MTTRARTHSRRRPCSFACARTASHLFPMRRRQQQPAPCTLPAHTLSNELKASRNSSSCASVSMSITEPLSLLFNLDVTLTAEEMRLPMWRGQPQSFAPQLRAPRRSNLSRHGGNRAPTRTPTNGARSCTDEACMHDPDCSSLVYPLAQFANTLNELKRTSRPSDRVYSCVYPAVCIKSTNLPNSRASQ